MLQDCPTTGGDVTLNDSSNLGASDDVDNPRLNNGG